MYQKIILIIAIVSLLIFGIYQGILKKEKSTFNLVEVIRGNISQEVSETGQVQKGDKINLSFKSAGRIEKIYVSTGEEVKRGDILAKLETNELQIQLQEAKSSLAVVQAKLDKLLAGATKEEIQASQTKVTNCQIDLNIAQQNLEDSYEDSLITSEDAYLKAYNSKNTVDTIQRTYFTSNDQAGVKVKENKEKIEGEVLEIKSSLDSTKTNLTHENIDLALSQIKEKLSNISDYLKIIREVCEEPNYRSVVSSTDKSSLDTQRTNIITALTNIIDSQQAITSAKLAIESAEGQLQIAKDNLNLTIAPPRQEDIDLYRAQIAEAQAEVELYENQIQQARILSPVAGLIAEINKEVGELVQLASPDAVITLLPLDPYEIELNIYEEDVVKVKVDNPVEISLIAFPEESFKGKVVSIDPAEKLIEGVVYYKVIINFEATPEGIKPGMTADVVIQTASKDNVLIISQSAIEEKDGKTIVKIAKGKNLEDREVQIGLRGRNDMVEVVSGLNEGETIAIPK